MTTPQAFNFLVFGLGLLAGPALWPQHFTASHLTSALWLLFMGALQAIGGAWVLGLSGVRLYHRLAAWEALDLSLPLPDVRWAVPPSLYAVLEESDEVLVALRLQAQLRLRVAT